MLELKDFTQINFYEDCPLDVQLLVWTGDSFEVEYVVMDSDTGTYYPANGVEFYYYIECPVSDFEKVPLFDRESLKVAKD